MGAHHSLTLGDLFKAKGQSFVVCAYLAILGREPDPEGLEYYLGHLMAGRPRVFVLMDLARSAEAVEQRAGIEGLRQASLVHVLARMPLLGKMVRPFALAWFPQGVVYDTGMRTRSSTEPQDRLRLGDLLAQNGVPFIDNAYRLLLGRAPDPEGLNHYLALLEQGRHPIEILGQLRYSREGRAAGRHVQGLLAAYRLQRLARLARLSRLVRRRRCTLPTTQDEVIPVEAPHDSPVAMAALPLEAGSEQPPEVQQLYRDFMLARLRQDRLT